LALGIKRPLFDNRPTNMGIRGGEIDPASAAI
jgi:hypothetical protein